MVLLVLFERQKTFEGFEVVIGETQNVGSGPQRGDREKKSKKKRYHRPF